MSQYGTGHVTHMAPPQHVFGAGVNKFKTPSGVKPSASFTLGQVSGISDRSRYHYNSNFLLIRVTSLLQTRRMLMPRLWATWQLMPSHRTTRRPSARRRKRGVGRPRPIARRRPLAGSRDRRKRTRALQMWVRPINSLSFKLISVLCRKRATETGRKAPR